MDISSVIGKTLDETKDMDWFGFWPELDDDDVIVAVCEGEEIPDDALLFYADGTPTDGDHGFDYFKT